MQTETLKPRIGLALTGASGAIYFLRLLERLNAQPVELHLIASDGGRRVMLEETGRRWSDLESEQTSMYPVKDIGALPASGSNPLDALVVVPCSMNTLAIIAHGMTANLIHRAAAVQLKERRTLILVPRETPLSLPNLKAMTAAHEAGALIMPATPGFYQNPQKIEDLVDTVVDRILDHLHLPDDRIKRWKGS